MKKERTHYALLINNIDPRTRLKFPADHIVVRLGLGDILRRALFDDITDAESSLLTCIASAIEPKTLKPFPEGHIFDEEWYRCLVIQGADLYCSPVDTETATEDTTPAVTTKQPPKPLRKLFTPALRDELYELKSQGWTNEECAGALEFSVEAIRAEYDLITTSFKAAKGRRGKNFMTAEYRMLIDAFTRDEAAEDTAVRMKRSVSGINTVKSNLGLVNKSDSRFIHKDNVERLIAEWREETDRQASIEGLTPADSKKAFKKITGKYMGRIPAESSFANAA